jgi:Ca2+-transporting ATPase
MSQQGQPFHAQPIETVLSTLDVQPDRGLCGDEVTARRQQYGPNRLRKASRRNVWRILYDQFKSVVILVLAAAGIAAFTFTQWVEGMAIVAVIIVNTLIGFISEWKARRSMEALRETGTKPIAVQRDGRRQEVAVQALVPGDILYLQGGDLVPADVRLIRADNLRVNEAVLTGESVAAAKRCEPVNADQPLAERTDMLFKGTTVVEGSAQGVVVATGMATELGRISELAETAEKQATPLEQRLDRLGRRLAWITLVIAIIVAIVGLLAGRETLLMIETAIALGVAAIPEGLPIVATIALARGMWLMAKRQAVINRLPAVETLGATQVIFTDKTGTLTENRMTLQRVVTPRGEHKLESEERHHPDENLPDEDPLLQRILEIGVLCNNASLGKDNNGESQGDPTEIALLQAGAWFGLDREQLLREKPEVREVSFDPEVMMMATFHELEQGFLVAVKGAPRAVLDVCDTVASSDQVEGKPLEEDDCRHWLEQTETLASQGLRLLAVADKEAAKKNTEPYQGLRLVGLVCLFDPPAQGVREAIAACRQAGIRVVMVTGDQPTTAWAIGRQLGLTEEGQETVVSGRELEKDPARLTDEERRRLLKTSIFARVSPKQKLHLVQIFQDHGDTVAMTGDGVNDTAALKKADIGVAMGKRGTDAARQVADMILKNDAFSSIIAAVQEGRVIFGNIRKSVMFMLCTNVAEILAVALASLASAPLPLLPMQILYLNVVTDVFPALALGVGKGDPRVMEHPPRPRGEAVLTRDHWLAIGGWSVIISACVLAALTLALEGAGLEQSEAVTVSFLTLAFAKLGFVFNLRDSGSTLLQNDVVGNPWIWGAIAVCVVFLLLAVYLPGLSDVLETRPLAGPGWGLVVGLSMIPLIVGQGIKSWQGG